MDLHVRLSCGGDPPELLIGMARHLGYSLIALSLEKEPRGAPLEGLRSLSREAGLDLAFRLDLKPSSPGELKAWLSRFRRRFEVIAVYCGNVAVARTAARDRRIDVTFYDLENLPSLLDEGQMSLLQEHGKHIEFNLSDMLGLPVDKQWKALWSYRYAFKEAKRRGIPIVFSSGASRITDMRAPRELSAVASMLLEDASLARSSVSLIPARIEDENRG
ncbi:MAG: RNase P subunit p30 family protein, partial [Desulfurococcaceae archaeon]